MPPRFVPRFVARLARSLAGPWVALLAAVAVFVPIATGATPAAADELPTPPDHPHIVGGSAATSGQLPFNAAVIRRGQPRTSGFSCTAVVLSRSWVLTAGHCVIDYDDAYPDSTYGPYVGPSALDVLTGTTSLSGSDGQRLQVAAVYPHPRYDFDTNDYDVALLRLRRPTSAGEIAVIGTSASEQALDDAGTTATVSGWGVTSEGGTSASASLRYVSVPVQTNDTCTNAYPSGARDEYGDLIEYHASNMLCAGPMSGGKDSCSGDSGGPLAVKAPDASWRLIGTVSFGLGCARPDHPGVYQRLTASSSWIGQTRRFGPFNPDATAFVTQQYRDFAGRSPSASELGSWRSKLATSPAATLITALQASAGWDGNAGMNARLYRAAFDRNPDTGGFDYWVRRRWAGKGPVAIANTFVASPEFQHRYGALDNDDFVTLVYQHVFDRDPDPSGRAYWVKKLNGGTGRGQVVYELSNSSEFRRATATDVRIITTRFGLLRAVPTAGEISASAPLSQRTLVDDLRTSYRYASRFTG